MTKYMMGLAPGVTTICSGVTGMLRVASMSFAIASLPGMKEHTIILDGFSKAYAMTGWRLGYGVMPVPLAEHVTRLMVNSASCTATFVQLAGLAALQGDQTPVARMVAEFKRRRDLIVDGLNKLPGVSCRSPRGAFYVFPNVSALGRPAAEIADLLLNEARVAALAGTAFGQHRDLPAARQFGDPLDLVLLEDAPRGILRRVDDDEPRPFRDLLLKESQVEAETGLFAQRDRHRHAAHEGDHRLVDGKAGVWVDDLVAAVDQGQDREEHDRLGPGRDHHFVGAHGDPAGLGHVRGNRFP